MHEDTRSEWKHWKGVSHLSAIPVQYLPPSITQVLVGEGSSGLGTGVWCMQQSAAESIWVAAARKGFKGVGATFLDKALVELL
eukprot:6481514-Amphidinium_carterae.2